MTMQGDPPTAYHRVVLVTAELIASAKHYSKLCSYCEQQVQVGESLWDMTARPTMLLCHLACAKRAEGTLHGQYTGVLTGVTGAEPNGYRPLARLMKKHPFTHADTYILRAEHMIDVMVLAVRAGPGVPIARVVSPGTFAGCVGKFIAAQALKALEKG